MLQYAFSSSCSLVLVGPPFAAALPAEPVLNRNCSASALLGAVARVPER